MDRKVRMHPAGALRLIRHKQLTSANDELFGW